MRRCHGFRTVTDEFARNQGILHADVAHSQTVADGNGGKDDRNTAAESNALFDSVDDLVEIHVPWHDVVLRADNADQRFADFGVAKTECFQETALWCGIDAFGKRITSHGYPFFLSAVAEYKGAISGVANQAKSCRNKRFEHDQTAIF